MKLAPGFMACAYVPLAWESWQHRGRAVSVGWLALTFGMTGSVFAMCSFSTCIKESSRAPLFAPPAPPSPAFHNCLLRLLHTGPCCCAGPGEILPKAGNRIAGGGQKEQTSGEKKRADVQTPTAFEEHLPKEIWFYGYRCVGHPTCPLSPSLSSSFRSGWLTRPRGSLVLESGLLASHVTWAWRTRRVRAKAQALDMSFDELAAEFARHDMAFEWDSSRKWTRGRGAAGASPRVSRDQLRG